MDPIDGQIPLKEDERVDPFLNGSLRLIQSRRGYRFSIDAVLLADFATVYPEDRVVDLGTGCGVILLILLRSKPIARAVGLEIQSELASQAVRNARLNGFAGRMDTIRADLRRLPFRPGWADVVTVNPPYGQVRTGRINPDPRRAIARHEVLASLEDILRAARHLLRRRGRLAMIYPVGRLGELLIRMRDHGLEPRRLQFLHPSPDSHAKLALVEASAGGRPGVQIAPPIFGQGKYGEQGKPLMIDDWGKGKL